MKIDVNNMNRSRGHCASVCVEINLTKPLVGKFQFARRWHTVEYEGFHTICYGCGMYGHKDEICPLNVTTTVDTAAVGGGDEQPRETTRQNQTHTTNKNVAYTSNAQTLETRPVTETNRIEPHAYTSKGKGEPSKKANVGNEETGHDPWMMVTPAYRRSIVKLRPIIDTVNWNKMIQVMSN